MYEKRSTGDVSGSGHVRVPSDSMHASSSVRGREAWGEPFAARHAK